MEGMIVDEILKKIEDEIKARGFTKKELAKRFGISPSTLSSSFSRKNIKLSLALRIAEEIGLNPREMFPKAIYDEWLDMPLIDIIRNVCQNEVKKVLLESKIKESVTLDSPIKKK